jgi:hypothetical protein
MEVAKPGDGACWLSKLPLMSLAVMRNLLEASDIREHPKYPNLNIEQSSRPHRARAKLSQTLENLKPVYRANTIS